MVSEQLRNVLFFLGGGGEGGGLVLHLPFIL